jgi:Uma2 family endonuclease
MAIHRVVLSYEDYLAMPDDGRRYEILEGEVAVTATPAIPHQVIVGNLYWVLRGHVQPRGLGQVYLAPVTVILANTTVVEPDLVYVDPSRAALVSDRGVRGAPTLAIEVLSPSTAPSDRGPKFQLYARYGIPYYWIADTNARVLEGYALEAGAYRLAARMHGDARVALPPFPDLLLGLDELWPPGPSTGGPA